MAVAMAIDAAFGWPELLFRRFGHPVTWLGFLIDRVDAAWNRDSDASVQRRVAGVVASLSIIALPTVLAWIVQRQLTTGWWGIAAIGILAWPLVALRSLHDHVSAVAQPLKAGDIEAARAAISRIVGRDPATLDEAGIARASIESLAENASDGVVAPLFWGAIFGLPGIVAYKAINTLDSMIGHRTPRHEAFGWAAARFDDLVNLPASRLAAALLIGGAAMTSRAAAMEAWRAVVGDARHHRSPNAGWPEAAMAGALGLALAGPRSYGGKEVADAFMGNGRRAATVNDIRRALALYRRADALLIGLWALTALLFSLHDA
jgi:adenosylcobinamide-phosphate synthase